MDSNILRELADKIERNEATFDDYKTIIEVQTRMLIEQTEIAARAISAAEKVSRQYEQLTEANNNLVWLANHFTNERHGTA